ncbi:MAG: hypothetical protein H7175_27325, partial [Burkholderiales bacterium]|nr:hypothetical protein [Anaerolineae bacterium]
MADSLFDNRYRYDYIYPRGRSGETLRAVDTQDNDRPVVIKRPAPNDAPPIRAGQEVSILNERKALSRLAGHAVLTALLGSGQFVVGGIPHRYIVMERAQGQILEDMVRELGAHGERLPELEMLIIVDRLLDLLQNAHEHDIVYNDVDAKHLFWDRDHYTLKVIDWGNVVFLEGDESTPQGISRQSDIYQVGELLYLILTAGSRMDVSRDSAREAGEDFRLDFGAYNERIAPQLQHIVSKAANPNVRHRYQSIQELRQVLASYRAPLERERNGALAHVAERLRRERSKDELRAMLATLEPALAADPGYPPSREAHEDIHARLRDLEIGGDLDAVRIYLESSNWTRAVGLLTEIQGLASPRISRMITLLRDWSMLLVDAEVGQNGALLTPPAVTDAIALVFDNQIEQAANLLLRGASDDESWRLQLLLAERVSAHVPEVMLLRPNLQRLDTALQALAADGLPVTESRALIAEINLTVQTLNAPGVISLIALRDGYRALVDELTALSALFETLNSPHNLPDRRLPVSSLDRALDAAMALADNMHVIGKQATSSPRDALEALDHSRAIDPTNPAWDLVGRLLNGLYELLQSYQTYVPAADGTDLENWLRASQRDLSPFVERLFDELLVGMVEGLNAAAQAWATYADASVQGDRYGAITALTTATDSVSTISPTLSGWLNQLRSVVTGAHYIERHAIFGGLGRALADGWEAFDRGRLADAERLAQQALEIARTDTQMAATRRLRSLTEITRTWVERNGIGDSKRTQATLAECEGLFSVDERAMRDNFATQMPSKDTYLRAMQKGLVEIYERRSTAALRILFFNFVLFGSLDAHEGSLEDALFWREAAGRTLTQNENAARHVALRALDDFMQQRRDVMAAAELLNEISSPQAMENLEATRRQLEESPESRGALATGLASLRELEAATRDWSDGEFRLAGTKLENAIHAVEELEKTSGLALTDYRTWLMELQAATAELYTKARIMSQIIERRPDDPIDDVRDIHQLLMDKTTALIGKAHASTLRQWRDTYTHFLSVYTDTNVRRSEKINRFNQLLRAMFIDRHPAYPLYRHWYDVVERAPEFPAPPTDNPTPEIQEADAEDIQPFEVAAAPGYTGTRYADQAPDQRSRGRLPRILLLLVVIVALAAVGLIASGVVDIGSVTALAVTLSPTPDENATNTQVAIIAAAYTTTAEGAATAAAEATELPTLPIIVPTQITLVRPTSADLATATLLPSATRSNITPSATLTTTPSETPTLSPTATNTFTPTSPPTATPSSTYTPTATLTPTLPPQGLQGQQLFLPLFNRLSIYPGIFPWSAEQFSQGQDGEFWRLGVGQGDGGLIVIAPPADFLETQFGNNAATRISRIQVTMALTTFNPALDADEIYFGALFQSVEDPAITAGLQVQVPQPGVINLGQRSG